MKKIRPRNILAAAFAVVGVIAVSSVFFAQAATLINDVFADGSSTNQDLANNSLAVYKARTGTTRSDAVGSVEYNLTNAGGADAYWAYFTASGAPVNLGIGDAITFAGTFSLTGAGTSGSDLRFGLLNSNGSRVTADKTGGQNDSNFADDTGYGAQFYPSGTGNPFVLYRKDASPTTNIFNSMNPTSGMPPVATGWSGLTGTGAAARQTLVDNTPYTFTYTVKRNTATDTQITIAVTGGALSGLNYTATESSQNPYTAFDWFSFRVAGTAFATRIKFTQFKVDLNPATPVITTQPAPSSQTVAVGANVTYSIAAAGSQLTYQWRKDGNPITNNPTATTANLQITNAQTSDSGVYTVNVTNSGGTATSDPVNLTVTSGPTDPAPMITQQPQNTTAVVGSNTSLSVQAIGSNLTYQWYKEDVLIGGATGATLNFTNVQLSDAGNYTVNVANGGGTVSSNPARLTIVSAITATAFDPVNNAGGICADKPLSITFDQTPKVGATGRIRVYEANGTLVDTIDLAAATQTKTIGGVSFRYYPIIVEGNTANIYLHNQLGYNKTFYVTMETGVLTDQSNVPFAGFSDVNTFRFSTKPSAPASGTNVLTVAADNTGDFCTIQAAIDFVPTNNAQRVVINVKNGTYTEIVYVPSNKPNVTVRGESRGGAVQQYANNNNLNGAVSGNYRASFGVDAANFNLETITLHNTTPQGGSQAEAFRTNGGQTTINTVNLLSFQDTILTQKSTYVANSYIEGDVDFMWGNGATFYKNTELKSLRDGGYYTQIRNSAANYGNVYVNCRFTKGANVTTGNYLGRIDPDDFPSSQVVILDSLMDTHIAPVGWLFNNPTNAVTLANYPNIRYWESNIRTLDNSAAIDCTQRHPISRSDCSNPLSAAERDFYLNPANIIGFTPPEKLTASVALSNLTQTYDGAPKAVTVTTNPSGLAVDVTYNGSPTAPTNAGTYTITATINDANYQGTATATLTIAKASAMVTLSNLTQNFDGAPKPVAVTTNPANLAVTVTYNGSTAAPSAIGSYNVSATITDPNYAGSAIGVLVIKSAVKAFSTAEGAGAYTVGGRGGDVYHVTNLNDSGAGSLRNGITSAIGARTIVFDVGGTIYLNTDLRINKSFITIAGQTAPGDGITIAGRTTMIDGAQHVIVRYLRFRGGDINCPAMQGDSFWVDKSTDVIVDHVSASWSVDETLSVTESERVTVQWSYIAESLNNSCHYNDAGTAFERHGYGALIRYGAGRISYLHNLFAHHFNRNPRVGDNITLDFVNNVIYDWGTDASYSGAASEGTTKVNYVGNYLVAGPNTGATKRTRAFSGGSANTLIFQENNLIDSNVNGIRDGADTGWAMFIGAYTQQTNPFRLLAATAKSKTVAALPDISPTSAEASYNAVLNNAGNSLRRDAVDARVASEVRSDTGLFIDSQNQVGGYPTLNSGTPAVDTDGDGIPDGYETQNNLNPNDPTDAAAIAANGLSNLENYLNSVVAAPTAADAMISGRVLNANGRGIAGARLTLTDARGEKRTVISNPFGYYRFTDVATGELYIIEASSKKTEFVNSPRVIQLNSELIDVNFTGTN